MDEFDALKGLDPLSDEALAIKTLCRVSGYLKDARAKIAASPILLTFYLQQAGENLRVSVICMDRISESRS